MSGYFGYCTKLWKYFVSRLTLISATTPLFLNIQFSCCYSAFLSARVRLINKACFFKASCWSVLNGN